MEVRVLLDSINPHTGVRLTTLHCVYPQFIHQQVLTHRVFSRNSSSLRAISFERANNEFELVYPTWTLEKKGMQGEVLVDDGKKDQATNILNQMHFDVSHWCNKLEKLGIHHQDINNYLRPFQNIHTVLSSTDWNNFFEQRLHETTKPDMQELAHRIKNELDNSTPLTRGLHIPLVEDLLELDFLKSEACLISAARLARISYFKWFDDPQKDLELAKKLLANKHLSPFEHIAFAQEDSNYYANFRSWKQLRHTLT